MTRVCFEDVPSFTKDVPEVVLGHWGWIFFAGMSFVMFSIL